MRIIIPGAKRGGTRNLSSFHLGSVSQPPEWDGILLAGSLPVRNKHGLAAMRGWGVVCAQLLKASLLWTVVPGPAGAAHSTPICASQLPAGDVTALKPDRSNDLAAWASSTDSHHLQTHTYTHTHSHTHSHTHTPAHIHTCTHARTDTNTHSGLLHHQNHRRNSFCIAFALLPLLSLTLFLPLPPSLSLTHSHLYFSLTGLLRFRCSPLWRTRQPMW